jgi:hypothetical protein
MTLRVRAACLAPDLRFGAARALADPAITVVAGGVSIRAEGCLPSLPGLPRYLRYADRDAVIVADGIDEIGELEWSLNQQIRAMTEPGSCADLSTAMLALDAVDRCFRDRNLWPGNIYLAGTRTLTVVLDLAGAVRLNDPDPEVVLRELAALELAYLFPIAGKFRSGGYDGQVQYRLNGWGRALAQRLIATPGGSAQASGLRDAISEHLAGEHQRYAAFLARLDVARQDYDGDQLDLALALPIPVLA